MISADTIELEGRVADPAPTVAVIDPRLLYREALALSLRQTETSLHYRFYRDAADLQEDRHATPAAILVTASVFASFTTSDVVDTAVVVLSDEDSPSFVAQCIEKGARGCVPTSLPLGVLVKVMQLIVAGGTFVPWTVLKLLPNSPGRPLDVVNGSPLSAKETLVARELSIGKPNKEIAYRLNMAESTVKVHVRGIMRKLGAKNRTQVCMTVGPLISADPIASKGDGTSRPS